MQDTLVHVWDLKQLVPLTCGYGPYTLQARVLVRHLGCVVLSPEQVDSTGCSLLVPKEITRAEVVGT
jgi:hypothetical protein